MQYMHLLLWVLDGKVGDHMYFDTCNVFVFFFFTFHICLQPLIFGVIFLIGRNFEFHF